MSCAEDRGGRLTLALGLGQDDLHGPGGAPAREERKNRKGQSCVKFSQRGAVRWAARTSRNSEAVGTGAMALRMVAIGGEDEELRENYPKLFAHFWRRCKRGSALATTGLAGAFDPLQRRATPSAPSSRRTRIRPCRLHAGCP